jgi:23S rRNA (cytosine1962-C5)-methyltransferase
LIAPPCVVFEDEHLLLVHKPAGWNTHAPSPFAGEGIYDWLRQREPRWATLAILHRLDKETSGLLVFGKSPLANRSLTDQFTAREIEKRYLLVTDRPAPAEQWVTETAIARAGERYLARPLAAGGERAETHFQVVRRAGAETWLEANPVTGRTHQIRVHAAHVGCPIRGDVLYGGSPAARVLLHARQISFRHPATGEPATFTAGTEGDDAIFAEASLALRAAVVNPAATDAYRVCHGAADGAPGISVDRLGEFDLVQTDAELAPEVGAAWRGAATRGTYLKRLSRHVRGQSVEASSPQLLRGEAAPERFSVRENGVRFELSFAEGYSYGLFLDQRDNRRRLLTGHVAAGFPLFSAGASGREVLNCFAYTCAFSVCAALGGARATSLDLSRKYLDWGRRNFARNGLDPADHDFICGDVFDWLRRLEKKGRQFDTVLLDPPTFSRSKEHGDFRAETDYGQLITTALPLVRPGGVLFASTNAARLAPELFVEQVRRAVASAGRRLAQEHYVPQPPDFPISRDEPAYLKTLWLRVD